MSSVPTVSPAAPAVPGARAPVATEYIGVVFFFILMAVLGSRIATALGGADWVLLLVSLFAGYVTSDLVSGLVHWGFDTWGARDTPVLGKTFIIPFRVHHSDPMDITRHGFIATNGHNCFVSIPVLASALFLPNDVLWGNLMLTFVVALTFGVFLTNQFHKWSHLENPPPVIDFLQRWHVILPKDHHDVHHHEPYDKNYCITTGWLNAPLNAIGFFRKLETAITFVTGARPRVDDLKHLVA